MGALVAEARADAHVAALVSTRVRGGEPGPEDAKGPGEYQAFVVISALDAPPHISVPVTFAEYALNAYGATHQNAWAVWAALVKAFHKVGPRVKANGLALYQTFVVTGGTQDADPDTKQPVVRGTLRVIASLGDITPDGS
jgi:hypothetical protein